MGLRQTLRTFSQPYLGAKVVNPIGDGFPNNADAQSYLASDAPVVQLLNEVADAIVIHQTEATEVNFQPNFTEHFSPFRFVYLQPENGS